MRSSRTASTYSFSSFLTTLDLTADEIMAKDARTRSVSRLEKLYVAAVKEGRTVDAAYYRAALKSMYPDWEYKAPPEEAKEEKK